MTALSRLCVYAGSQSGGRPEYAAAAAELAGRMAEEGMGLVYGGGRVGLMGVLADTMLAAGGEVIGIMPQYLVDHERAHMRLTDLRIVGSMHERKQLMADLSDGFVAVPGGIGTLEELIEMFTWRQLGMHAKPLAVLDVAGYYTGLSSLLDHMFTEGFLRARHLDTLIWATDPSTLITRLRAHDPGLTDPHRPNPAESGP